MCGIAGYVLNEDDQIVQEKFDANVYRLRWRGPDHQAEMQGSESYGLICKLFHSRLSIIDLSENGNQPFFDSQKEVVCSYNGEIYNYLEIKEQLVSHGYEFHTESDTEVLLAAWKHWGADAFAKFTGMFAVAIYDLVNKKLHLARDLFGIKPLYYASYSGGLIFASDPVTIASTIGLKQNDQKVIEYIAYGTYDNSEHTFYSLVKSLVPGAYLSFDLESGSLQGPVPWTRDSDEKVNDEYLGVSFESAAEDLREKIISSVDLHLRADVDVAVALSGGIDSSILACLVRKLRPNSNIRTFSYIAPGRLSEEEFVDKINDYIGAAPTKIFSDELDFSADLNDLILAQGEPFASLSIFAQYAVFREVRKAGIKVSLDGQGADELFSGYYSYALAYMSELLTRGNLVGFWRFLTLRSDAYSISKGSLLIQVVSAVISAVFPFRPLQRLNPTFAKELHSEVLSVMKARRKKRKGILSHKAALHFSRFQQGLPALLRHGDRNSMYHSVESRVPFLEGEILSAVSKLPSKVFFGGQGISKSLLREALRGLVPDEILGRIPKVGFEAPDRQILLQQEELLSELVVFAGSDRILDQAAVVTLVANVKKNNGETGLLWRLINYMKWKQLFFTEERHL